MPERIQKRKQATKTEQQVEEAPVKGEQADLSDIDDLLDEIDSVLEENAQEFVEQYVQRGGQ